MSTIKSLFAALILATSSAAGAAPLADMKPGVPWQSGPRMPIQWLAEHAPRCDADKPVKVGAFPSKMHCDDGDATLFNGMLCAAGVEVGCDAVSRSFNTDGWRRSPRLSAIPSLRGGDSFSPDMSIGVQLYLLTKRKDEKAMEKARAWVAWLDASPPCWATGVEGCVFQAPFPRFCKDDTEKGCTLRPGDAAILAKTVRALGIMPAENTRLGAYLRQFESLLPNFTLAEAIVTDPGYPRHLIVNSIWVQRLAGVSAGDELILSAAAEILSRKEPMNAFFAWARGASVEEYVGLANRVCPVPPNPPANKSQWTWERTDSEQAWKDSMLWDCLFIARLGKVADSKEKLPILAEKEMQKVKPAQNLGDPTPPKEKLTDKLTNPVKLDKAQEKLLGGKK